MDIGANIRKFRILNGFSQQYMANTLGVSQRQLSRIENNQTEVKFSCVQKISHALGISFYQLINHQEKTSVGKNHKNVLKNNSISANHLMKQYEKHIAHLETEVAFLRKLLEQKNP